MTSVGSRELKNRLGKYLKIVREGRPVEITDRGKPIARIVPLNPNAQGDEQEQIAKLIAKGGIHWGTGRIRPTRKRVRLKPGPSIVEMISEDRR